MGTRDGEGVQFHFCMGLRRLTMLIACSVTAKVSSVSSVVKVQV